MNSNRPHQYSAATHRAVAYGDASPSEAVPSRPHSLAQRLLNLGQKRPAEPEAESSLLGPAWDTLCTGPDTIIPSEPFRETMDGLVTREVTEPEVFSYFFGPDNTSR
jgi:hypothetical protein